MKRILCTILALFLLTVSLTACLPAVPEVAIVYHEDRAEELGYFSSDPDLLASYGVRIISYEYAEPIENTYE